LSVVQQSVAKYLITQWYYWWWVHGNILAFIFPEIRQIRLGPQRPPKKEPWGTFGDCGDRCPSCCL